MAQGHLHWPPGGVLVRGSTRRILGPAFAVRVPLPATVLAHRPEIVTTRVTLRAPSLKRAASSVKKPQLRATSSSTTAAMNRPGSIGGFWSSRGGSAGTG